MLTAAARISFASSFRSSSLGEYSLDKSMMGISSGVQSLGGVLRTSRNTGPYAVRSSNLEVMDVSIVVMDILMAVEALLLQRCLYYKTVDLGLARYVL